MPLGVVVELVLFPHAGVRMKDAHSTKSASTAQALRTRFPLAAPIPTSPSSGAVIHKPKALRELCAPVVIGPNVLIVRVALSGGPVTCRLFPPLGYVNEHTGAIVTSGLIVAHARVTPSPCGLTYPLIGFTVTTPCAPLPATTLLGATVLVTLMVNCGVTERTVSGIAAVVTVEFALVPVIVMLYWIVVVSALVVTVAVAVAGTFTEAGLTRQIGGSVIELSDGLTWQLKFTMPVKPVVEPI